jgi:predicted ATP-binding protein involved in virulence
MKLSKITIENFRCFSIYDIVFAKQATVLFGKNGTGKSTLIHAIHKAMSVFFTNDKAFSKTISSGNPDLKVANIDVTDIWYDVNNREVAENVSLKCEATFGESKLDWEMMKGSTSRAGLKPTLYKNAFLSFMRLYNKSNTLPVFSYYSDSYPHIGTNIGKYAKDTLNSGKPLPRNFGYYQWAAETSCTSIWELRFLKAWAEMLNLIATIDINQSLKVRTENELISKKNELEKFARSLSIEAFVNSKNPISDELPMHELELKRLHEIITFKQVELSKFRQEIEFIRSRLIEFSKPITFEENGNGNFEIKNVSVTSLFDENRIVFTFSDNREVTFEHLPQGFKRLISIVFDISYRAFILNGDVVPSGIVLIDEIDLHLHPSLEQEVLQRFKRTFPQIQFIVTTHSPLVLTNLNQDEENKVVEMFKNVDNQFSNRDFPNLFGVDYSTMVRDGMGVRSILIEIEDLTNDYYYLLEKGNKDDAEKVLAKIKELVGHNSIYIQSIKDHLDWINN